MSNLIDDITIIIVLYQEKLELIQSCLKNIKNFKIIIIDNDNNLEIKDKIVKEFKIQKYILHEKNIGFTKAANIAINLVDTKYAMNLNADCLIKEDAILELVLAKQKYQNCFIISPTFYNTNNELTLNSSNFVNNNIPSNNKAFEGDVCVDWVLGSAILFEKKEMEEIGMFDNNLFLYFPDKDICRRGFLKKKSTILLSKVRAIHSHGVPKTKNFFKKIFLRNYHFTFDELYYYYKINKHHEIFKKLKNKIPNYFIKILFSTLFLRLDKIVLYVSKILAFYKFKNFLKNK